MNLSEIQIEYEYTYSAIKALFRFVTRTIKQQYFAVVMFQSHKPIVLIIFVSLAVLSLWKFNFSNKSLLCL